MTPMAPVRIVLAKELTDALRDRRTWVAALASALVVGPVVLLLLSVFLSGLDQTAARREFIVAGAEHAPTLVNYLQRAGATVVEAPADYESGLIGGRLQGGVIVVEDNFEAALGRGDQVTVRLVFDSSNPRARGPIDNAAGLLQGFNRELGAQRLLGRGIAPALLGPLMVERQDLAPRRARGAELLFMIPWMALLMSVVGALPVAIDVGAGERERGSLEPLLSNPVDVGAIVLGKWLAVATMALLVVILTLSAYVVTLQLVGNEVLAALMQFGPLQALQCAVLLAPFAGLMGALMMLVATWGRTYKEAQTYASQAALVVNLAPVVTLFLESRDAPWQLPVPVLGQLMVMMRILRGQPIGLLEFVVPGAICALGTIGCLLLQRRLLGDERIIFGR